MDSGRRLKCSNKRNNFSIMLDYTQDPDTKVMVQFTEGDDSSFDILLEKYQKPIINMIYRIVKDRIIAEDLAQEVFLKVYMSRESYKPRAKFSTWIYKIALNNSLNHLRYLRRHRALSLDSVISTDEDSVHVQVKDNSSSTACEDLQKSELHEKIKEAVDSLPEKQRLAVILSKFQELPQKDISEVLGCSVMAVKLHLYRARITLKEKLSGYIKEGL